MFHSSNCCRLCINFCNDPQSLYYADGRKSEVYKLMEKYFTPRFLNMERGRHLTVICTECWRYIFDFHNFQLSVLLAQNKLVEADQQSGANLSTSADEQQLNKAITVIANLSPNPASGSTISNYNNNVSFIKEEVLPASDEEQSNTPITAGTYMASCSNESVATTASTFSLTNGDVFIINFIDEETKTAIGNLQQESELINNLLESIESDVQEIGLNNNLPVACDVAITKNRERDIISSAAEDLWKSHPSDEEFEDPIGVFIGGNFNKTASECSSHENQLLQSMTVKAGENRYTRKNDISNRPKSVEEFDEFIARWRPNLECVICTESCSRFTQLLEHFNEQHPNEECYIRCCQHKLSHRYEIEEHIHYHKNTKTFKCEVCLKSFTRNTSLNRHLRTIHSEKSKDVFKCPICLKCYASKDNLQAHIKNHKSKKLTKTIKYTCSECEMEFSNIWDFGRHQKLVHVNSDKMHKCTICDKAYKHLKDLKEHMGVHTGNNHTCPHCTKTYTNRRLMLRHIRKYHPKERYEKIRRFKLIN